MKLRNRIMSAGLIATLAFAGVACGDDAEDDGTDVVEETTIQEDEEAPADVDVTETEMEEPAEEESPAEETT